MILGKISDVTKTSHPMYCASFGKPLRFVNDMTAFAVEYMEMKISNIWKIIVPLVTFDISLRKNVKDTIPTMAMINPDEIIIFIFSTLTGFWIGKIDNPKHVKHHRMERDKFFKFHFLPNIRIGYPIDIST